jgi:peptide/nickel transport system permease protein
MITYIVRRIVHSVFLMLVISMFLFGVIHVIPGGPFATAEHNPNVTPEQLSLIRERLGLSQPIYVQYVKWVKTAVIEGDWGYSIKYNRPVTELIWQRLPATLLLLGSSFIVTLLVSVPFGLYAAIKPQSAGNKIISFLTFLGQSIPDYSLGLILLFVFYISLQNPFGAGPIFPSGGLHSVGKATTPGDVLWHMILPVFSISFSWIAWYARLLQASMRDELQKRYIQTAHAKGLRKRAVYFRHAFRNAIVPLVTIIALDFPAIFGGSVLVEAIFSWPGMGRLFWDAARERDHPILLAVIMINVFLVLICNLVADLFYAFVDPRIQYK